MDYKITFKLDSDPTQSRNTWDDWNLVPDSPPMVNIPEVNTNYIEIPGRKKGPIDATNWLRGFPTYKRTTGTWNFYHDISERHWDVPRATPKVQDRFAIFEDMRTFFTGKVIRAIIYEDRTYYYKGRITVTLPKAVTNPMSISLNYDFEPVRYRVANDSVDDDYPAHAESVTPST